MRSLGAVSRSDARDLIASLRKKDLKLNTIKGIARTLSTVLSQAVEDDKIAANPALRMGRYLRRGDEPKRQIEPLTRAEARHLVSVAQRDFQRWSPWILCALRTGMRLGELNALQWGDIDWNGRFIVVRRNLVRGVLTSPKSHRERKVDVSLQLRDALAQWHRVLATRWLKKAQPMPDWVFPSREGTALEERNVRHVFTRLLKRAGLRQIRIHDLRHTFASLLLQQGESIVYVKDQLGHSSIQITVDTYGHLIPGANRTAVDGLDDDAAAHADATQAQPEPFENPETVREMEELFGKSGEPKFRELEPAGGLASPNRSPPVRGIVESLAPSHALLSCVFNNLPGRVIFQYRTQSPHRCSGGMYNGLLNRRLTHPRRRVNLRRLVVT
jgi:integrase